MKVPKFLVGLLIGGLLGLLFWYWQKSTSAEDGALSVLDRLAASEARVRELEARLRRSAAGPVAPPDSIKTDVQSAAAVQKEQKTADDLQQIDGIGPTYARRLQEGGILTFADLAAAAPDRVKEISGVRSEGMAESWINEARERLSG